MAYFDLIRTLGAIAVIIPERKEVHHNIRNALDSHDTVEVLVIKPLINANECLMTP